MKKLIALFLALVCVLGLVGCGQNKQQDLSLLNYENLVSIAAQSETLSVSKSDIEDSYSIEGLQLAQFLDVANWTAQTGYSRKVQRNTEQNSNASIQITFDGVYLKIFDTDTAIIYDETLGKERYYQMSDGDYNMILEMITPA